MMSKACYHTIWVLRITVQIEQPFPFSGCHGSLGGPQHGIARTEVPLLDQGTVEVEVDVSLQDLEDLVPSSRCTGDLHVTAK